MDKTVGRIVSGLESVSALLLFAMMALTFVDVIGRDGFGRSVPGSTEIIQVLLAVAIACALPAVTWQRQHIGIGLFEGRPLTTLERLRQALVALISAVTFAVLCGLLWRHAGETAVNRDVIGYLQLPVAPVVYALSIFCGVTAAVFVAIAGTATRCSHEAAKKTSVPIAALEETT
jgi:TRAP-type C4-dicarboxylate transport system permease small subunit